MSIYVMPWAAVRRPDGTANMEAIDIWTSLTHGRTTYITDVDTSTEYVTSWFGVAFVQLDTVAMPTETSYGTTIRNILDRGRGRPVFFDTSTERIHLARTAGAVCVHLTFPTFTPEWKDRTPSPWEDTVAAIAASGAPVRSSPDENRIRGS